MKNCIRLTFAGALSLSAMSALGQGWDKPSRLEDTEIIVEKDRKIELPTANRVFEKVKVPPPAPETRKVEYNFADLKMPNTPVPVQMRVLTVKQEELPFLYGNYVQAAFGNYGTPYLHGYFHNTRNSDYSIGAEVRHISSSRGPVEKDKSGMSNSSILLKGEAFRDALTIGAQAGFERDKTHFYGYDRAALKEFGINGLEQKYNRLNGKAYLNNYNSDGALKGQFGLGYNRVNDNYETSEGDFQVEGKGAYQLGSDAALKVEAIASFIKYKLGDVATTDRSYLRVRPYYQGNLGKLNFQLGGTVALHNDTLNDVSKFQIYPHIVAAYELLEDKVTVFGGLTGDLERKTLYNLSRENPWLAGLYPTADPALPYLPNLIVQNTNKQLDVYGGLRGNLGPQIAYQAQAGYRRYRNLYFFNNSPLDSARFSLFYDAEGTSAVYTDLELNYNASERFRIGVKTNFTSWNASKVQFPGDVESTDKALHRPSVTANVFATYNLQKKIFFTADLYYIGATDAQNLISDRMLKTDAVTDLSLKADYRFSERFSAFLMFNNVLAKKYERYLYYPVQGFQAMAGVSYIF